MINKVTKVSDGHYRIGRVHFEHYERPDEGAIREGCTFSLRGRSQYRLVRCPCPRPLDPDLHRAINVLGTRYLAPKMGVSRRTLERWRAGVYSPTPEHLERLRAVVAEG